MYWLLFSLIGNFIKFPNKRKTLWAGCARAQEEHIAEQLCAAWNKRCVSKKLGHGSV